MNEIKDLSRLQDLTNEYASKHHIKPGIVRCLICTEQWIIVTTDESAGMGFHLCTDHYAEIEKRLREFQPFTGKPISHLLKKVLEGENDIFHRALAMAAINCVACHFDDIFQESCLNPCKFMTEPFSFLQSDDVVTVVGHGNYGGMIDKIYEKCREYHVIEKKDFHCFQNYIIGEKQEKIYPDHIFFHDNTEEDMVIPKSDIVILTGSTLVNDTYSELIRKAVNARIIAMFGPTAQGAICCLKEIGLNYVYSGRISSLNGLYQAVMHRGRSCSVQRKDYMKFYMQNIN